MIRLRRLRHCTDPSPKVWLTHMKTTIEISDAILRLAKQLAARRNTTLRDLIETALRDALEREAQSPRACAIKTHTFRGNGQQPGLSWDEWSTIRDLAYEGRGA